MRITENEQKEETERGEVERQRGEREAEAKRGTDGQK